MTMFLSSTTPLNNNGSVTLGPISADRVDYLKGYIKTDQAATLLVEQSFDGGSNWDIQDSNSVVAGTTKTFSSELIAPLARIRVTNASGSNQTYLRVYAKGSSAGDS